MGARKSRNRYVFSAALIAILVVGLVAGLYLSRGSTNGSDGSHSSSGSSESGNVINVVAAENFWGSLASQLGGVRVNVTCVVTDPNADPHEFTSNPANAEAISNARLVIVNGAGYDTWALRLLTVANAPNQVVLNVQELLNQPANVNPHFWYSPYYVNSTIAAIYKDLARIDPVDKEYFTTRYAVLNSSLWSSYMKQEGMIKQQFGGAPVAATEDVFVYMANATGLNDVSPPAFMQAVAEGSEPSAKDIASMQNLMAGGNTTVRVLVYNQQTVTPLTESIKMLASRNGIPIVGITETVQPPTLTFQAWMQEEVAALANALNK